MPTGLKRAEKMLICAVILMSVICVGLVIHDDIVSRDNLEYFVEVSSSKAAGIYLVNVNTAGKDELMELSGVGEVIAGRIIDYRSKNGDFTSAEDLLNVEGIGKKTLEGFIDDITF